MAKTDVRFRSGTLEDVLWDALHAKGTGFVSLTKSGLHPQPVVAFTDRRRRRLWLAMPFDNDLVRSIGDGASAIFTAEGPGLMVSIGGSLCVEEDTRRLARMWTVQAQAWRPQGPRDPGLALLRMDCLDAELSLADLGLQRFSWDLGQTMVRRGPGRTISPTQQTLH
jgi:general stress protein 26